jgi:mono/diheme cytochrome c family protein
MTGTATPHDERRARRARREKLVSACSASSAFLFLAFFSVATTGAQQQALTPVTDTAAVERGKALLVEQCGFCHGSNARGGSGGPDLTRSVIVQEDEGGKQLGAFLRVGRPDRGMPKFDLPDAQMSDLAAFLHSAIYLNANRRPVQDPRYRGRRSESGRGVLQRRWPLQQLPFGGRAI